MSSSFSSVLEVRSGVLREIEDNERKRESIARSNRSAERTN
jgi:hypothetical protein